jgi:hemerythrin-like domain-containing protein
MDALQLLEAEHDDIEALLQKLEKAKATRARHLFQELADQLDLVERLEQTYLYPPLRADPDARELALEHFAEHDLVDRLVAELKTLKPDDQDWQPKVKVLKEELDRHIRAEETELFPRLRLIWDADKLRHAYRKMEQLKAEWKKQKALGSLGSPGAEAPVTPGS